MTTILLVEDDATVRELVTLALEGDGYAVESAASGAQALDLWRRGSPDVVLLDVMLPEPDGIEVCRRIRQEDAVLPIVMLTAKSDPIDVVLGLESGADDYVTKPFETRVLLARIRAILRRQQRRDRSSDVIRAGPVEVDQAAVEVRLHGERIELTPIEYGLLVELARHPGRVLTREVLLERVWDYDYLGDSRLVDVGIGRLRGKIEDDPSEPKLILTRRGFGYVFASP